MTPEGVVANDQPMSEAARLAGVYFSPGKAFADIAARPRFWVPLIISMLFAFGFTYAIGQHVGWDSVARQQMESSPQIQNMPADQRARAVEQGARITGIIAYASPIFVPIGLLIGAAVLLFIFNAMFSAQLKFKQVFAVICYAGLTGVISTILSVIVMYAKSPEDFNIQNPLAFNLGAFFDPNTTSKALIAFGSSIDLFTFWTIALIAIGLAAAGRKLTFGKALAGVLIPWGLWVCVKVGLAALRS
jgi:Yip1 domain